MSTPARESRIEAIRRFNRFYTRQIGLINNGYLESEFSLTEARVLYELAYHAPLTAKDLCDMLGLDAGYMSRLLRRFDHNSWLTKKHLESDRRQILLGLSEAGGQVFAPLNDRSREDIGALLDQLTPEQQDQLVLAMDEIERSLSSTQPAWILRDPQSGDMGWVVKRHGEIYAEEYGWNNEIEAMAAELVAHFIEQFDPACERCWIAERDGVRLGSIFLVKHPERQGVAKLRMLIVEPAARGQGIARRLVTECIDFARASGYHTITLWTNSVLEAATHVYAAAGFQMVHEAPHHAFGQDLIEQTWEMAL